MKINPIIRTVSRDDQALYGKGIDGKRQVVGHPLRDYLARKDADGFVSMPLPARLLAELGSSLTTADAGFSLGEQIERGIDVRIAGPGMVRFSLDKWRDCDPDNTFLLVAFAITPRDDAPGVCSSLGRHR
jgi:hypothetical protein